jgi:hypothetical protein
MSCHLMHTLVSWVPGAAQDEPAAAADQEKKSKKKSKKDLDGLFASLGAEQPAEAVDSQPGAAAEVSHQATVCMALSCWLSWGR